LSVSLKASDSEKADPRTSQQRCRQGFRRVWCGLKTKAKLWDTLRSLFRVLVFESMEALFRQMASLCRLQLE
jgi:hypothetical protein